MRSLHYASNKVVTVCAVAFFLSGAIGATPGVCGEKSLYKFKGGSDGATPQAGLISDSVRTLYGTTVGGGGGTGCDNGIYGCGTVFSLTAKGVETILHAFTGGADGALPFGGVIADASGNLYGAAEIGGSFNNGTVFRIAPDGTETTLYSFQGGSDGFSPLSSLLMDAQGDLFGTTLDGGSFSGTDCTHAGCGTVFELKPDGTKPVLYTFMGGSDGWAPQGALIADKSGNLYGTTTGGGDTTCPNASSGCGTVFEIGPGGTETELYAFHGGSDDGSTPAGALVADAAGNFYGTTFTGGDCSIINNGCGTVFKVAADGTETVLHAFRDTNDGAIPEDGLVMDNKGNLFGTTYYGGSSLCGHTGCGTVFEITAKGEEKILYAFKNRGGRFPTSSLLLGAHGKLYGTTSEGGKKNNGVVFELKK
jgi:uncharacterized repeat protein (TIGR03803 family)